MPLYFKKRLEDYILKRLIDNTLSECQTLHYHDYLALSVYTSIP